MSCPKENTGDIPMLYL